MMLSPICKVFVLMLMTSMIAAPAFAASGAILTKDGRANSVIIVAQDASDYNQKAAVLLQSYLQQISGAQVPISNTSDNVQGVRIWIGEHPQQAELIRREPRVGIALDKGEEILQFADAQDVVIRGSDRFHGQKQVEVGTYLATQRFIIEQLGVRWLWPGELGTDIPRTPTVTIAPFFKQYAPQMRYRRIRGVEYEYRWRGRYELPGLKNPMEVVRKLDRGAGQWLHHHNIEARLNGSRGGAVEQPIIGMPLTPALGHYFSHWHEKYYKDHPEWFALQPDGTRGTYPSRPTRAKLCITNPEVLEQYLDEATEFLQANPHLNAVGIGPNDNGWFGYCVCENCKALDEPTAPKSERALGYANGLEIESPALTDRFAHFWNAAAQGLRERFPDRKIYLMTYAYNAYRSPPVATRLDPNIMIQFEGIILRHRFQNSDENMAKHKKLWKGWAKQAALIQWRPNFRLAEPPDPYMMLRRYGQTMNFLAKHSVSGIDIDTMMQNHWSSHGPQYYLAAVMTWDPHADPDAIMDDYYSRAYGPAAESIRAYYQVFEDLYYYMNQNFERWSAQRHIAALYRELRIPPHPPGDTMKFLGISPQELEQPDSRPIEKRAAAFLAQARKDVADADPVYRKRVEFAAVSLEFTIAHLDVVEAMQLLRRDRENPELIARANAAYQRQQKILMDNFENYALNYIDANNYFLSKIDSLIPPDFRTHPGEDDGRE